MKQKLRAELLDSLDQLYVETVGDFFPEMEISEAQSAGLRDMWKMSSFRKAIEGYFRNAPDEQFPLFKNLLQRLPLVIRTHLRNARRATDSGGGRTPLLTDHLRRNACEEVRNLQQRGLKLQRAIEDIATLYGLEPKQLMGIWKHRTRYKDPV